MQSSIRWGLNLFAIFCFSFLMVVFLRFHWNLLSFLSSTVLQTFKTMFISIILEALPFVLLGVVFSSLLQIFVSERLVQRLIPKNPLAGVLFACILGVFFPVCECGLIPVVRRLIKKGMPGYVGMTFMLSGPVLNPVVYASTATAFRTYPQMAYTRMVLAFAVAFLTGLVLYWCIRKHPLKADEHGHGHHHDHDHHDHSHGHQDQRHNHDHEHHHGGNKISAFLTHAGDEFFEMGKFLIFGSVLTALLQTVVSRGNLTELGQGTIGSHLFMMGFAYILSLCSTSDAFVASSFMTIFSKGSLLAFLVLGPMLDVKSTMMLFSVFKARYVFLLCSMIIVLVFAGSIAIGHWYLY